ncbi:MAG: ATP-binding cassette domain-containing protein [Magnetococcales bacterium]|nr:ATP-binding cassette domain-containing protein [Magnetococcales bacterium]
MTGPLPLLEAHTPSLAGLTLSSGERVAVLGGEASGKSRLLRLLAGLEAPEGCRVRWRGEALAALPAARRAREIGVLFRDPDSRFLCATPGEEIALGLPVGEARDRVAESLAWAGLEPELAWRSWVELSAAQRYRVAMAVLHAARVTLWLIDEPGGPLSDIGEADFSRRLSEHLRSQDASSVIVTSRASRARRFADRVIRL